MSGLVTIIITTYQGTETLARAIESVLNQTYKNIEIIVVDDNGLGTKNQIETEKLVSEYPTVVYLKHKININGAAARNTGIKKARGEFICFLDDDDFYYSERIERQLKQMQQLDESYAVSYCSFNEIFSADDTRIIRAKYSGFILFEFMNLQVRIGSSIIMVRKSVIEEINGFDETFVRHQDWEFLCRILVKYKVASLDYVGVGRVILNRNAPSSPEKVEKFRLYYLNAMAPIIQTLSETQKKQVWTTHYIAIAKEYFCAGNYIKYKEYSKKSGKMIRTLYISLRSKVYRRIKRR